MAPEYQEANLLYYFWLPAGKDEFGIESQDAAPLAGTVSYKKDIEKTIARSFRQQSSLLLLNHDSIGGMNAFGEPEPQDGELGLRKLHFPFTYQPSGAILNGIVPPGPISGTTIILSNGLYLWSFRITYDKNAPDELVTKTLTDFIKQDFVENCIRRLFDFDCEPDPRRLKGSYKGILNYYQLDLLFNGLYDTEAHPYHFFEHKYVRPYSIRDVICSASLYGFKEQYLPLWDRREDYSQRGAMIADRPKVDTDMDLQQVRVSDAGSKEQEQRELLLSRLSFSAMEQFIRVSIPFGLANYRAGLDHCRHHLIGNAMLLRRNQASSDFVRPSLEEGLLANDIGAYYLLLSAKMPAIVFFKDLIEDMIEVTHPLHLVPESRKEWVENPGWEEWRESKATLSEADDQLKRQVAALDSDLGAINVFLTVAQSEAVLVELGEARKLNEIEVEDPRRSVMLASRDWEQLTYWLTAVAVVLAAFQAYSGIGVWIMDTLLRKDLENGHATWRDIAISIALWIPVILVLFLLYLYRLYRRNKVVGKRDAKLTSPVRQVPNILDCAFPRVNMLGQKIEDLVSLISTEGLIDISTKQSGPKPASMATFREASPGSGERVKYSIESAPGKDGISYTLHLEVQRQLLESSEQLRNVRIVVRTPADKHVGIDDMRWILQTYASRLIHESPHSDSAREYFQRRFGWSVT